MVATAPETALESYIGESVIHWKWVKVRQTSQVDVLCGSVKCSVCSNIRIHREGGHLTVFTDTFSWSAHASIVRLVSVLCSGQWWRYSQRTTRAVRWCRPGQNAWFALNYIITGSLVGLNGTQYNKHTKTFGAGLILLYRSSLKALQLVSRHMASILCDYCVFAKTFWLLISLDGYNEYWGNKKEGRQWQRVKELTHANADSFWTTCIKVLKQNWKHQKSTCYKC